MSKPCSFSDWHGHAFEEFSLCTGDRAMVGQGGKRIAVPANVLFYYRRGVTHGYWNDAVQSPRFWVLHFAADSPAQAEFDFLRRDQDAFWTLSPGQVALFEDCYLKLFLEHTQPRRLREQAEATWLRLLFIEVQRWSESENAKGATPPSQAASPEVMQLWQLLNESVSEPGQLTQRLQAALPNYDSVRHAFKAAFGCSPKKMLLRLRIQQAKNLLLETRLSMKEIADLVGYPQQHEFTHTFSKMVGVSPTKWRENPQATPPRRSTSG
ncbi:MAG: helix-turn-helix transcriptional regulator [Limisphaerales bacterium]